MIIEIPDAVMNSDLTLSQKLVVGMVLANPMISKTELAKQLGISRRLIHKSLSEAKLRCAQEFSQCEQGFSQCAPPCTRSSSSVIITETPPSTGLVLPSYGTQFSEAEIAPPSKEEVLEYAVTLDRADLVDEFYTSTSSDGWKTGRGEPILNWRKWFKGWAAKKPRSNPTAASRRLPTMTAEQARMQPY